MKDLYTEISVAVQSHLWEEVLRELRLFLRADSFNIPRMNFFSFGRYKTHCCNLEAQ